MSLPIMSISDLYAKYIKWVASNPAVLGDVEMTVKWVSYFIAGKINSSSAVSELVYTLSNLLVLFNDRIIEKANGTTHQLSAMEKKIKLTLTTLEYCEVFIELSALKVRGSQGRWFVIVVIQVIKCLGRLMLTLICSNNNIVQSPPLPQLDRKNIAEDTAATDNTSFQNGTCSSTLTLKRSGKVLRKVEGAPPIFTRNWKPLEEDAHESMANRQFRQNGKFIPRAELIYILKPIVHLGSIRKFGLNSWKSYIVALLMDLGSLNIYYKNRGDLSKEQKLELSRRCVSLLLYLMRSPLYDKYSKPKIAALLNGIGNRVPLTGSISKLILSYIPHWQETYFYMWST